MSILIYTNFTSTYNYRRYCFARHFVRHLDFFFVAFVLLRTLQLQTHHSRTFCGKLINRNFTGTAIHCYCTVRYFSLLDFFFVAFVLLRILQPTNVLGSFEMSSLIENLHLHILIVAALFGSLALLIYSLLLLNLCWWFETVFHFPFQLNFMKGYSFVVKDYSYLLLADVKYPLNFSNLVLSLTF